MTTPSGDKIEKTWDLFVGIVENLHKERNPTTRNQLAITANDYAEKLLSSKFHMRSTDIGSKWGSLSGYLDSQTELIRS